MNLPKKKLIKYAKQIPMILLSLIWVYPFLWMISTSLKTQSEVFSSKLNLIPQNIQWENYTRAWVNANFSQYFFNSTFITLIVVFLVLIMTSMAGYALGRRDFVGKKFFLGCLVGSMFIPEGFMIIPLYDLMNALGVLSSRLALILIHAGRIPRIFVLLFMGYFSEIPQALEDAAKIDGCGFLGTFFKIMMPVAKPIIATVIIFQFMWTWNEFLFSLVFTMSKPALRTVSVGVYTFVGEHSVDWTGMAAAATISLLPTIIVFLFLQKYFIRGLSGSVKG